MIKLGNNNIGGVYLGENKIGKAYLGENLIYQNGPTPPRPVPVFYDYLIFDGTAYIDTNIIPNANASYRVNIGSESSHTAQRLFVVPATDNRIGAILSSNTSSTYRYFAFYYGDSSAVDSGHGLSFDNDRLTLFLTPKRCGWGSKAFTFTKGSSAPSGGLVIGSNPDHSGQAFTGSIKGSFKIYGSAAQNATDATDLNTYTPQYTLRPCTCDGEAGLWCEEKSRFYGNTAGAGTLTVANEESEE